MDVWALLFLALGIAYAGRRIGRGLSDCGESLRIGLEEMARSIECLEDDE